MSVNISTWERYKDWLYRTLTDYGKVTMTALVAFIVGQLTSQPVEAGITALLKPEKLGDWLVLGAVAAFCLVHLLQLWLKTDHQKRQYTTMFASITETHKARAISPYVGIAWDEQISLVDSPELHRGWSLDRVKLHHEATKFSLPEKYKQTYKEYFEKNYQEKRFFDDGMKAMLTRNPTAFSDTLTLVLNTKETLYSEFRFFSEIVNQRTSERDALIRTTFEKELSIQFPHSLGLAIILITNDDKVLIVRRSPKVEFDPLKWTCSIDEQFDPIKDLQGQKEPVANWIKRALWEEVKLDHTEYSENNLRILSVFLESDKLSISLCSHAILDKSASQLDIHMSNIPPEDREFDKWEFLTHKELLHLLLHPDRDYDATAGYRMLMALMRRYGVVETIKQITNIH